MAERPTLVPLSEDEQKLVCEVLEAIVIMTKIIAINQSLSGPRHRVCFKSPPPDKSKECNACPRLPTSTGQDLEHESEISAIVVLPSSDLASCSVYGFLFGSFAKTTSGL